MGSISIYATTWSIEMAPTALKSFTILPSEKRSKPNMVAAIARRYTATAVGGVVHGPLRDSVTTGARAEVEARLEVKSARIEAIRSGEIEAVVDDTNSTHWDTNGVLRVFPGKS